MQRLSEGWHRVQLSTDPCISEADTGRRSYNSGVRTLSLPARATLPVLSPSIVSLLTYPRLTFVKRDVRHPVLGFRVLVTPRYQSWLRHVPPRVV